MKGLQKRRSLIETALQQSEQEAHDRREALAAQLAEVETRIATLNSQLRIQSRILEVSQAQLDQALELAERGSGSLLQVQTRTQALLEAQVNQARLQGDRETLLSQRSALADRGRAEAAAAQSTQALLRDQQVELEIAALEAQRRTGHVVIAPEDGEVVSILKPQGAWVGPGEQLVTLLPHYDRLEAHLMLPVTAVGSVSAGDRVTLRLDATSGISRPRRLRGSVRSVSATPISAEAFEGPFEMQGRFHRVVAILDAGDDLADRPIEPGMTLNASISYRRDPLWRVLFLPEGR